MIVYIKGQKYNASGEYDPETKRLIVYKGAMVSESISSIESFKKAARNIEAKRREFVRDNVLLKDVEFLSASGAANFITGRSTNGMLAWKCDNGKSLNEELFGYKPVTPYD